MDYDLQIAEKNKEKQKLIDEMEVKKGLFLEELTKFTINWFNKTTLSTVKTNGEKVVELGDEKAKELKREIENLTERSSELVSGYMENEEIWWHRKEDNEMYFSQSNRLLEKQEKPIRIMLGELGRILVKYGIVKATSVYNSSGSSGWSYDEFSQSNLKYTFGITFTDKLLNINNEYIKLIEQAKSINSQIRYLEEQRKSENVEEWWQSL